MKQGMFWSRASLAMMGQARLERAGDQPLVADGAVLGGQKQRQSHRLHLAKQDQIGGASPAIDHFRAVDVTATRSHRSLHEHWRETDAASDEKVDRVGPRLGKAGPERTQDVDFCTRQCALEQSGTSTDCLGQNLGSTARTDRHKGERSR